MKMSDLERHLHRGPPGEGFHRETCKKAAPASPAVAAVSCADPAQPSGWAGPHRRWCRVCKAESWRRPSMENADVAQVLAEVADLLELTGGNAFKARAYRQAAQIVDLLPTPVSELWREGKLTELPSIGERIAAHIEELLNTGRFREHDQLLAKVPPGVLELLKVEGIGPKTASLAWKRLRVKELAALVKACRDGSMEKLPRMGAKRVAAILLALERYQARKGRVPLHRALATAESIAERLRKVPHVRAAEVAGSIRRRRETIGDIDLLVAATGADEVIRAFREAPEVETLTATGPTKCTARLKSGLQADLRIVPPESFGAALHYFTGSKAHNIELRTRAMRRGLKLSEYGVFDRQGKRLGGETEQDVYRAVGLPWIPPELREGAGELEAAEEGRLPRLIEEKDVRGDLHVHSEASSDAHSSLEELCKEAGRLGREYLAITDHSKSRPLGLDAVQMRAHALAIQRFGLQREEAPRLLTGVEVDILQDGTLDLPLDVLQGLDWVVASIHSHFTDPPGKITQRMIAAMRSGVVDVLGHPGGRQLGLRDAYAFDFEKVLEVARAERVALEVNAMPERLDLDDKHCRLAKDAGVALVISTDAHHASQLGNLRYGVWMARRGWLERGDVLNTLGPRQLEARLHRPRHFGTHIELRASL
ncbi:MAG: DNA polymerase/3'-5' exonuclease PolX [Myxococcaceae bacterium]|nr:MAG: DNA polymerase/3'-5' exonuclease PolX [Myxococcaceae bacterium]